MFGFVIANPDGLSPEERARYKGSYCGLCRALGDRGTVCRFTLNYDLTFLALLQSALYEPEEERGMRCCPRHPFVRQEFWRNPATDYAADMNLLLTYEKFLDDWHDEKKISAYWGAHLLRASAGEAGSRWPRQAKAIKENLRKLAELEQNNIQDIDAAGACFGALMSELFVWRRDRWETQLRVLGDGLGRYIYTLDAVLDLKEDEKKNRYNPLLALDVEETEQFRPSLEMLLGGAAQAFESLPLVQDVHILRSVLYSGIWARFPRKEEGRL